MAKLFGLRRRAELTVQCPAKALSFGKILNNHQTFRRLDAGRRHLDHLLRETKLTDRCLDHELEPLR